MNEVEVHVRVVDHTRGLVDVRTNVRSLGKDARDTSGPLDGMAGKLAILGGAAQAVGMVLKPSIFAELIPVALGAAAAAVQVSGALLVLPGIAASAGIAVGTLKIATMGFGDALKEMDDPEKFAEALKKLSPAAQASAIAIRDLKGRFDELKKSLQERLFAGLAKEITETGKSLMGTLQPAMERISSSANKALKGFLQDLRTTEKANLSRIGLNAAEAFGTLSAALNPILRALLDIADVGAHVFSDLTASVGTAAQRFEAWIATLKESGRLEEVMRGGISAIQQLGAVVVNVFSIVRSIMGAAGADGQSFLNTLQHGTQQLAEFFKSFEGQALVGAFIGALRTAQGAIMEITTLAPAVTAFLTGLQSGLATLSPYLQPLVAALGQVLITLTPLLPVLGQVAATVAGALTVALVGLQPILQAVVAVLGFLGPALGPLAVYILAVVSAVKIWTIAQAALNIVLSLNPIGLVIIAIGALIVAIVLVVKHWDTIVAAVKGAWQAIQDFSNGVKNAISGFIQSVGAAISGFFQRLGVTVAIKINEVLQFFRALPGNILGALGSLGNLLVGVGRDIVNGLWQGIQGGWDWLLQNVRNLAATLFNAAKSALGIGSPSKLFRDEIGKMIPRGIGIGITVDSGKVRAALDRVWAMIRHRYQGMDNIPVPRAVSSPEMITPGAAYSDPYYTAAFSGGAARIRSATHAVQRTIPAQYAPSAPSAGVGTGTGPSGGQVAVIGRNSLLGQLLSEILRKECRGNGGNVQLWLGA